jgi:hypothetical protein
MSSPLCIKTNSGGKGRGIGVLTLIFCIKFFWPLFFFYFVLFLVDIKFVFFDLGQRSHKSYD